MSTHQEYFDAVPSKPRELLRRIQAEVELQVPDIIQCISYGMPAFKQKRIFFYFASFKNHIGIYPPITEDAMLIEETKAYRGPKGNLSFPLAQEVPIQLIGRVAVALAKQYARP